MIIMNNFYIIGGILTTLIAIIFYYPTFFYIFIFFLYSIILILFAVLGTLYLHFLFTAKSPAQTNHQNTSNILLNATKSSIFDSPKPIRNASQLPIIFGRTVDGIILQIIEYTLRDLIAPWLCHIVRKPKFLMDILREDIWNGIIRLRERAIKIDASKMIAVDMVLRITVHMEKIRIANSRSLETGNQPLFATTSYLVTTEKELEFLGKLSEIMIIFLLPKGYSYSPIKNLLCEILSYKILYPTIKLLTVPDYINQKIVQFIETKLAVAAICKRSYEYAASFEDVLKIINSTENLDDLLLIRTTIINDIMQATAMQNLQRAKGLDPDDYRCSSSSSSAMTISGTTISCTNNTSNNNQNMNNNNNNNNNNNSSSSSSNSSSNNTKKKCDETTNLTKSDITASIKLKRYIQQLTFAKTQCEKNLTKYGWEGNYSNDLDLSMLDILSTVIGRRYLILFLEPLKASGLVGFYSSVEELKNSARNNYHQIGAEIFYTYIRAPLSDVKVDKQVRKRMESFLLGDQGPEIFYETQQSILKTLDERYYSPFLLSEQYQQLKNALTSEDIKDISIVVTSNNYGLIENSSTSFVDGERNDGDDSNNMNLESIDEQQQNFDTNQQTDLTNNSTYARNKLEQLQEKLNNKIQALDAIKSSLKPESKLLAILEKDVDWLKMEKRQMEAHLSRTEIWSEHLGKWRATVQSVEIPDEKEPPQFMILVQADNVINVNNNNNIVNKKLNTQSNNNNTNNGHDKNEKCDMENISTGWVVLRSLNEIHELRRKLRPLCNDLRLFDLPTTAFKLFFLKNDRSSLDKAKGQIQKYLNFVLENEHLYQSEALYEFLSPSSEHLRKSVQPSPKKSKFSLSTLFKSDNKETMNRNMINDPFWGPGGSRNEGEEDISMFLEGISSTTTNNQNNNGSTKSTSPSHSFVSNNNTSDNVHHTPGSGDTCKSDSSSDSKDSIAEPLYALMGEIFDMGGVFNWIRRRLISFVQITYGRTINRQIRESINSLFDEAMLQYYATTALKSFWPGGVLASSYPERTEDMKEMTENAAKSLLIDNIPEVLCNLVGAQTAKHGAFRVFEILQNATYNKQLFYELVEILMLELFPEIRQLKHESFRKKN